MTGPAMAAGQLFRVLLRMQAAPGKERDFPGTWLAVGETIAVQPGNLGQSLMRSHDEPGVFYVLSDWVDEEHFRGFEHSAGHAENRRRLRTVRAGVSMTTMWLIHSIPAPPPGHPLPSRGTAQPLS